MTAQNIDTPPAATNAPDLEMLTSLSHEDASWPTPGRGVVDGRECFYDLHAWDEFWS